MPATPVFRHFVRVEKPAPQASPGADGHVDTTVPGNDVEHCGRHAEVIPTGVQALLDANGQRMGSITTVRIRLRYDEVTRLIDTTMWILWRGSKFYVAGAYDEDGTARILVINATQRTA